MSEEVEVNVANPPTAERPSSSLFEGMRRMALASIGAVAITRDEVEKVITQLVDRGELAQKEGETLRSEMSVRFRQTKNEAENATQDFGRQIEQGVEQFLNRLNVPSKRDIDELSTKIAQLNARVEELRKSQEK